MPAVPAWGGADVIANVYIDGFNVYYGCLKGTPYKWLDPAALARRLLPSDQIRRIRYFTARVNPRVTDPSAPQRQDTYLRAVATIPCLSVHLGHFLTSRARMPLAAPTLGGPSTVEVLKTEEKGSDVNLATYLLVDAFRGDCEVALVITNDSDLCEPIRIVSTELGIPVGIANPYPARRRSHALRGTFFKQIRPSALAQCQFPPKLKDDAGTFARPATW
jgi:NYN domain